MDPNFDRLNILRKSMKDGISRYKIGSKTLSKQKSEEEWVTFSGSNFAQNNEEMKYIEEKGN